MSETAALAIVELLDRDGQVRQSQRVLAWPLRIGRALDNGSRWATCTSRRTTA